MSNLNILGNHNVDEIYYYRLSIETNDNTNSSLNNTTSLTPSKNYQYSSYDYVINNYQLDLISTSCFIISKKYIEKDNLKKQNYSSFLTICYSPQKFIIQFNYE